MTNQMVTENVLCTILDDKEETIIHITDGRPEYRGQYLRSVKIKVIDGRIYMSDYVDKEIQLDYGDLKDMPSGY